VDTRVSAPSERGCGGVILSVTRLPPATGGGSGTPAADSLSLRVDHLGRSTCHAIRGQRGIQGYLAHKKQPPL